MSYTSINDYITQYGKHELEQLTAKDGARNIDERAVNAAIVSIDSYIDSMIGGRYPNLLHVPDALNAAATDLVREKLFINNVPEVVGKRADQARKFIADIRDGRASLDNNTAPASRFRVVHKQGNSTPDGYL